MSQTRTTALHESMGEGDPRVEEKKAKNRRPASALNQITPFGRTVLTRCFLNRHCVQTTEAEGMAVSISHSLFHRSVLLTQPRPILTPKTVLPIFFATGIIFALIGGLLLWASASVRAHARRRNGLKTHRLIRFKNL